MFLTVGRLDPNLEENTIGALEQLGVRFESVWQECEEEIAGLDLLNIATQNFFVETVARAEGFADATEAIAQTRFRNLPWWMTSIWLPAKFTPPSEPILKEGDWPIFTGSCQGLLEELLGVSNLLGDDVANKPPGYDEMRTDIGAFSRRTDFELTDERHILQWVWNGLRDGAEVAIKRSAPMFGAD